MDLERKKKVTCEYCDKEFSNPSARNKHMSKFHGESKSSQTKNHIICPMCTIEEKFSNFNSLNKHLTNNHNITIKESVLHFRNLEEFLTWRSQENREVDYACQTKSKLPNGNETIYYICNRSDYKGYTSTAQKRNAKIGGTIRIHGVCPSRYIVKAVANGSVMVTFVETHVGHSDELRNKRLTKAEEETIVTKLKAGITNERIISDARQIENNQTLARVNLITRGDLRNLIKKHNIGPLRIDNPSKRLIRHQDNDDDNIEERSDNNPSLTKEQKREIKIEEMMMTIKNLDNNEFERFEEYFTNFISTLDQETPPSKKSKIDKQKYHINEK